jgi:hypothetical protein
VLYEVITIAGGSAGFVDSAGNRARFNRPNGLAVGRQGSIFVADFGNNAIRKVTPQGVVTTLAGGRQASLRQDGLAAVAAFSNPRGVAFDQEGVLFIADFGNNQIRQLDGNLVVRTIAGNGSKGTQDGECTTAAFLEARDLACQAGYIFVADRYRVRRVNRTMSVQTWAGSLEAGLWDGVGVQARFGTLSAIAADNQGNIFVVDADNSAIRYITPLQKVGTLAGADVVPPEGSNSFLQHPVGIDVDTAGNCWVTDVGDYTIKRISPQGVITQIAGSLQPGDKDGLATAAQFGHPSGIAVAANGLVYITDLANHSLRCLRPIT